MLDSKKEWSISFAGCGFMGIYYVGATSCILERFPRLIHDASKIYGASAGALMATVLAVGIPLEKCCADLMFMATEGRKHKMGTSHPFYNSSQIVKDSMVRSSPEDAHIRASGKLSVSSTRVPDGKNVLVSEFDSREELIQALLCSCFVPFYCGVVPPTYRGVHYVDGAVSDNSPRCHSRNTITFSAYAGESDLCPRGSTLNFHEVRFNNVSIQVTSENMYRVKRTFFPPEPEAMAEICHNGYMDALHFSQDNNSISGACPMRSSETDSPKPACCESVKKSAEGEASNESIEHNGSEPPQEEHWWSDTQLIEHLPVNIKKALCEACRETHAAGGSLSHMTYSPKKVTSYSQIPSISPMGSASSLAQRLANWIPDVPRDMSRLYGMAVDIYKQAWKDEVDYDSETPSRRCTSLPLGSNLSTQREDLNSPPMTPESTPTSSFTFTCDTHNVSDHTSLTPPPTPTFSCTSGFDEGATESPKGADRGWGLGQTVGWIRSIGSKQILNHKKTDDSVSFSAFK